MLVWACIAPHGGEIIPELANGNLARMARTRAAMEELGRRCEAAEPETVVALTPHGICIENHVCVSVARIAIGTLDGETGQRVDAAMDIDLELALTLAHGARAMGVPVAEAGYEESGAPMLAFPMDWGTLIPLWYMGARWERKPNVVVVCPDRSLSRRQLIDFGRATVWSAERLGRRIAVVCSADQGHGHDVDGPYGFSPASAKYDRSYCRTVRDGALASMRYWRSDLIEAALADSFWQTLMLHGAIDGRGFQPELLSYEAPTYFGMACASYDKRRA